MTLRSLASIIWGLLVIVVVASAQTGAGDPNLDNLREQLRQIDAELSRVRLESLDLAAQSRAVADDIAELDREESLLGPVKRARYDRLRQRGAALTDQQTLLDTARDQLLGSYGDVAQVLVDALTAEIDRARAGYQLLSRSSSEAATEWRRFVELRRERQAIQDRVTPTGRYIELDVFIEPDDSAETLERRTNSSARVIRWTFRPEAWDSMRRPRFHCRLRCFRSRSDCPFRRAAFPTRRGTINYLRISRAWRVNSRTMFWK
jgi:hypothetical protein